MLNLSNIFESTDFNIDLSSFIVVIFAAVISGVILSYIYKIDNKSTKSFSVTLILLPTVVSLIIMMVNGNIGTGVAVAGAFSLVRFRSIPGKATEITAIFEAMGIGLTMGMGYIIYAFVFLAIICIIHLVIHLSGYGSANEDRKTLKITIAESLDYQDIFNDEFDKYLNSYTLNSVKSTNMGSMFKLNYEVSLKEKNTEKDFIDQLRIKNGNLEVSLLRTDFNTGEL